LIRAVFTTASAIGSSLRKKFGRGAAKVRGVQPLFVLGRPAHAVQGQVVRAPREREFEANTTLPGKDGGLHARDANRALVGIKRLEQADISGVCIEVATAPAAYEVFARTLGLFPPGRQ
jgi:hypothetical protein